MKAKSKILLTSLMSIAFASSLIAGSTYALFTSKSEVNIAVTSGKVKVNAAIDETSFQLYSLNEGVQEALEEGTTTFVNGGTVSVNEGTLTLDRMTPGDKVEFYIDITNESNVAVKYKTVLTAEDEELLSGLAVTIGEDVINPDELEISSPWAKIEPNTEIDPVHVSIELPEEAGNEYQDKAVDLKFAVEAIQGNVATLPSNAQKVSNGLYKEPDTKAYYVTNGSGFKALNDLMLEKNNGVKFESITLYEDIDMTGKSWTPVDFSADSKLNTLSLINGNGHTISNMSINGQAMFHRFVGKGLLTIKDLTFDNAVVTSSSLNTSIFTVQTYQDVLLENVNVKNSSITGTYKVAPFIATVYDESVDKSISVTLKNCHVLDTEVRGTSYDFMIAGMVAFVKENDNDSISFENCSVKNVTLVAPSVAYNACAFVYCNDGSAEGSFNEVNGVTVTNCQVEYR